jgi:hypothetical protein
VFNVMNSMWFQQLPKDEQTLIQQVISRAPGYWSKTDIECVAFVAIVYGLALHDPDGLPYAPNAAAFWDAYAHTPGWTEILNGHGVPAPGDIVVLDDGGPGHVAIVTDVTRKPDGSFDVLVAQANTPTTTEHWTANQNGTIQLPSSSPVHRDIVKGMIRYVGDAPVVAVARAWSEAR